MSSKDSFDHSLSGQQEKPEALGSGMEKKSPEVSGFFVSNDSSYEGLSPESADSCEEEEVSPEESASWLSLWTQSWFTKLLIKGWKRPLLASDLYQILRERRSKPLTDEFEFRWAEWARKYQNGQINKKPSVFWICAQIHRDMPAWGLLKILSDASMAATSLIMQGLVQFLVNSQTSISAPPLYVGICWALGFLFMNMFSSFLNANVMHRGTIYGVSVKGQLTAAIYRKAMRLSGASKARFGSGKVLNMVSSDLGRVELAFNQWNFCWTFPFWFAFTAAFLIHIIGVSGLAGLALLVGCMPLQGWMIRHLMRIRKKAAGIGDDRIKLTSEILQGIRIIKFFTWEGNFLDRIASLRKGELHLVRNAAFIRATIQSLGFAVPAVSSAVTFLVYGALNPTLSPVQIFACLALFNQLRQPVMWLPMMLANIGDAKVAFDRLQEFFEAAEVDFHPTYDESSKFGVTINDGVFDWDSLQSEKNESLDLGSEGKQHALRGINLRAPRGRLTAIVGAVGSGKSSLLSALIGEMKRIAGEVTFCGSVGYCSQQAWIVNATVRENIVFGRSWDSEKYARVVSACCLASDFEILPNGDASEIGERGINLSGGQKQRVALARLMYTGHEVSLLDDSLSAVDASVGKIIFNEGIRGLLSDKTRLFVTHQLHLVPECDWVVVMKDGVIAEQGSYDALMKAGGEFSQLMKSYGGETDSKEANETVEKDLKLAEQKTKLDSTQSAISNKGFSQMKVEGMERGTIKLHVFASYLYNFGTPSFLLITLLALILTQATRLSNDLWLVSWTQNSYSYFSQGQYMEIYSGLGLAQAGSLLGYSMLFAIGGVRAARLLHEKVLTNAVASPVGFFDQTPLGRIVNRLSKDVDYADNSLYDALRLLFYTLLQLVATFSLVSYFTKGLFLVVLVPMMGFYIFIQMFYRTSSREIKRIESVSRSPLYAHISESMSGLATIRAYGEQQRFIEITQNHIDTNSSPLYLLYTGQRWIQLRLETIGNTLVFALALFAASTRSYISPSQIGLSLAYLLQTTSLLNMAVFQAVEAEVQLNAVERLVEYLQLTPEEKVGAATVTPEKSWPSEGNIQFVDVEMRYQPNLPLVLKGISFNIPARTKVGIVGRTGSGKSSIMQALFRMVPLARGHVLIDGLDTASMSLQNLRSRLAIIPQDPVLFTGTIRSNLDPNSLHADDEIWNVLQRCGMHGAVADLPQKLDSPMVENGENFSVGQRQLFCLARAVLLRPRVLVMDECTASVDLENDFLIQQTIRSEFADATTLTIAHRLNTVIDSDLILVMDQGNVIEFDSPHNLLQRPSAFSALVNETGPVNASLLRQLASQKLQN